MIKSKKYKDIVNELELKSKEQLLYFLQSYSSELRHINLHCTDLCDSNTGIPYIRSVLASGLKVLNDKNDSYHMSEDVHQKAKSIIGYVQKNKNHNYSTNEIMFSLGYIAIYYKLAIKKVA